MIRTITLAFITLWAAVSLAFFALRLLPGDAVTAQLEQSGASDEDIALRLNALGLDQPVPEQYIRYLALLVQGDLGISLLTGQPVSELMMQRLPPTLALVIPSLAVAMALGLFLGGIEGLYPEQWRGRAASGAMTLALSVPIAWTATLLIYLFTVQLNLLPSAGEGRLSQLILPVSVLGFHSAGAIARVFSANVQEIAHALHVRTAHAKGLKPSRVRLQHILRPALLPVLPVISLQAGYLIGGTVMTESLFVRPGLGKLLFDSVIQQDYPVVQGIVVLSALVFTFMNTLADAASRMLDPRMSKP